MVHGGSEVWPYVFALDRLLRLIAVPVHISSTDGVRRCDRHDGTGRSAPGGAAPLGGTRAVPRRRRHGRARAPSPPPAAGAGAAAPGATGAMVVGRRFNAQATALTKQGRLAVYPSSTGQEACEVAAALVLRGARLALPQLPRHPRRWSPAASTRCEALTLLRGDWHTGYDPRDHRVAPLCTPLATQLPHAVGLAHAARRKGDDVVALAWSATAAPARATSTRRSTSPPCGRRRSSSSCRTTASRSPCRSPSRPPRPRWPTRPSATACPAELVDGNDVGRRARGARRRPSAGPRGRRPDPGRGGHVPHRGRTPTPTTPPATARDAEVEAWRAHDPIALLERSCAARGLLDDDGVRGAPRTAEEHGRRPARRG